MKICCRCKIEKSYDCFYKWNKSKDGFTSYCRECKKKDYKENREHYLEIDKKSRNKKDKETIKLERKLYRQKHRDRINKCSFDNYHKNKPDRKIKRDKYRSENKDAIKQQKREFYKKHKEKKLKELEVLENNFIGPKIPQDYRFCNTCGKLKNINEFGNSSSNKRWKSRRCKICAAEKRLKYNSTIEMRLINRVRQSLRKSLTAFLFKERNRTLDYLGCDLQFFKSYLESKFLLGMTWDKFLAGEIHIDHCIPRVLFDLSDESQVYKCFHYTNLQPLWETDNLSKSDVLPDGTRARYKKRQHLIKSES